MEVLLSTDSSPSALSMWEPRTGTKLLSLKGPSSFPPQGLSLLKDEGVVGAEEGKPFIHLWGVGRPLHTSTRILCPGKAGPLAFSPDGNFLVVAVAEKINIWQVASGRVVRVLGSAHYRPVTCLRFTEDGSLLLSAGEDGAVLVWSFLSVVGASDGPRPLYQWTDHTFPVTGLHVGTGGRKGTVFSSSLDRFLKVYSLLSGSLLLSVAFPTQLSALAVDAVERRAFLGGVVGEVWVYDLTSPPRGVEAQVTGQGAGEGAYLLNAGHKGRITSLAVSGDDMLLASGDESGEVTVWDLPSKQALRRLVGGVGRISNLIFWLNDPELLKGGSGKKASVVFPQVPKLLESSEEKKDDELLTVWNSEIDEEDMELEGFGVTGGGGTIAEVNDLKTKLDESYEVNRKLHQFCVDNIFPSEPERKKAKK